MATQNAEQTFSELCDQAGIPYERIPTAEVGEKSPDYKIVVSDHTIIVEIKQFDPNPEEKKLSKIWKKKSLPSSMQNLAPVCERQ